MAETAVSCIFWLFAGTAVMGIAMGLDGESKWGDTLPGARSKIAHWSIAIGAFILLVMAAVSL